MLRLWPYSILTAPPPPPPQKKKIPSLKKTPKIFSLRGYLLLNFARPVMLWGASSGGVGGRPIFPFSGYPHGQLCDWRQAWPASGQGMRRLGMQW